MAVYAVGDVQGCLDALRGLLGRLGFDPGRDRLWLTGDLVNRGPRSLETLRFVRGLGEAAVSVLGNHDLHLLAVAAGAAPARPGDTLDAVLSAPDRDELLEWLRHRPLLHRDTALGWTLVHAGLPPQWDPDEAAARAREAEAVLRGPGWRAFLGTMYGDEPARWDPGLEGTDRLRFVVNALTRLRYCTRDGALALRHKGPPGSQPAGLVPWYDAPARRSAGARIVFGHWSTLGALTGGTGRADAVCLDGGCVWGGRLLALRLDATHARPVAAACPETRHPEGW